MQITIGGTPKEVAALAAELKGRQPGADRTEDIAPHYDPATRGDTWRRTQILYSSISPPLWRSILPPERSVDNSKGGESMSEKEKQIVEDIRTIVTGLPENEKHRILGVAEGLAMASIMSKEPRPNDQEVQWEEGINS